MLEQIGTGTGIHFKIISLLFSLLDPNPGSASLMRITIQGSREGHLNTDPCGSGFRMDW